MTSSESLESRALPASVPAACAELLLELEARDREDDQGDAPKAQRVRCVSRAVGELLHFLVLSSRATSILEIGTSAAYSTIWLASAARLHAGRVVSIDNDAEKTKWAQANLDRAGLESCVALENGGAVEVIGRIEGPFDLVLIDHSSSEYVAAFEAVRSKMAPGGLILADGWSRLERWSSEPTLSDYRRHVREAKGFSSFLLPLEKGLLVSLRLREEQ